MSPEVGTLTHRCVTTPMADQISQISQLLHEPLQLWRHN